MNPKLAYADDHFHDECGVFGVFGHPEAANLTYLGLYALQHRGQESAGIVSSDGQELHLHRAMGEVEEIFQPAVLARLPGTAAIGHARYSTAGDKALLNAQPIMIDCNKGKVALGHNGNLTNAAEWRRKLEHRGSIFQTNSDTEVIVHLIARSPARNLSGAIGDALNQVEGAYSLLLADDVMRCTRCATRADFARWCLADYPRRKLPRKPGWWLPKLARLIFSTLNTFAKSSLGRWCASPNPASNPSDLRRPSNNNTAYSNTYIFLAQTVLFSAAR